VVNNNNNLMMIMILFVIFGAENENEIRLVLGRKSI